MKTLAPRLRGSRAPLHKANQSRGAWHLILLCGALSLVDISGAVAEEVMPDFVRSGTAGFVISHIQYALAGEASEIGACPDGMNSSYADPRDAYINFPEFDHQAPATFEEPRMQAMCLTPSVL